MSHLLLDTVSHNKNPYSYFMTVKSSTAESANKSESVNEQKEKVGGGSNLLTAGMCGLGVIGMSLLAYTGGKLYKKQKINAEIKNLKREIKDSYNIAKSAMLQELVNEGLPKSFTSGKFYNYKIKSSNDIKAVGEYYKGVYDTLEQVQVESSNTIRESIKKVASDAEWQELHKYRKQLLKQVNGDDINKHDIALKKISLINDMLVYKLHPEEEEVFKSRNLISVDDARMMIKRDFANKEEYDEEYQKFIKYTFNYSPMTKFFVNNGELSLLDLFKSEIIAHKVAGDKKLLAKLILDEDVPEVQRRNIQKLISLANEFSKDEKVLRLKSLTSSKALS